MQSALTIGEAIPLLLRQYGVDTIFGIPGVHTIEMYRGLSNSGIRHITPRHEQSAGFMADGFARVSGRPGVCFIITGPGLTNIVTAMAQAMQDSIPMLVISSVNPRHQMAMGEGRLHELADQRGLIANVCRFNHTLLSPENLPQILARSFAVMSAERPGPVHIEIPTDVLTLPIGDMDLTPWPRPSLPTMENDVARIVAKHIAQAQCPVMIVGGGARHAGTELTLLAEKFALPIINTTNGKGIVPHSHPLSLGGSPSTAPVRALLAEQADVILAMGTEFGETDFDFYFTNDLTIAGKVIRIDIDSHQLYRNIKPFIAIQSDSALATRAILEAAEPNLSADTESAKQRISGIRNELAELKDAGFEAFFQAINDSLVEPIVVADSCQPSYYACEHYETEKPNCYFHSASGFGTLGYAIPAAIGSQLAMTNSQVVCISGDGGSQFSATDLISAVEAKAPVIFIIWLNNGHKEIRNAFNNSGIPSCGVDIAVPDYCKLAQAMGLHAFSTDSLSDFKKALAEASEMNQPSLITVREEQMITPLT